MAKVMKSFTMDSEVSDLLKGSDNASGLINNLIKEHFSETTSNDPKVLESKQKELELESEIINKKLNHIKDKIRIIKQKEIEEIGDYEYAKILNVYNTKVEALNQRWRNKEFDTGELDEEGHDKGDLEYWRLFDELSKQKPLKKLSYVKPEKEEFIEEKTQEEKFDEWENRDLDLTERRGPVEQ